MSIRAGDGLKFLDTATSSSSLRLLGAARADALAGAGLSSLNDLLKHPAVSVARLLVANARGNGGVDLSGAISADYRAKPQRGAPSWPLAAIAGIKAEQIRSLEAMGIATVSDLALLAQDAEKVILTALQADDAFFERPSAPAELVPTILGQEASSVRFASFVKDTDLEDLALRVDARCAVDLPVSGRLTGKGARNSVDEMIARLQADIAKKGLQSLLKQLANVGDEAELLRLLRTSASAKERPIGNLTSIFSNLTCPVIRLGYIAGHRQSWINLGTNLGEVVHSISLAPGESRNIAQVNWYRRQALSRSETTTESEDLTSKFVQNRAIEEITSAVAREHQYGGSATEASTSATAFSVVGSLAVGAGIGATIGTVIAPGVGTAIGAALGAGISGAVAAGVTTSSAQALGTIQTDTSGDRSIVAENQQRIQLSTSQVSSTVRSLWSTIVLEDVQAETVNATTSNITNYNHMHALNMQYYEVLQRYLVKIELDKIQPIMLLPFTFLDFTSFDFVRDYWDVVREHIDDEGLRDQGDAYFVTEDIPTGPDLLPVPPEPERPSGQVRNLRVLVSFVYDKRVTIGLSAKIGSSKVPGQEDPDTPRTVSDEDVSIRTRVFEFGPLNVFDELTFQVEVDRADGGRFTISLEVMDALITGNDKRFAVSGQNIGSFIVADSDRQRSYNIVWDMPDVSTREDRRFALERAKHLRALAQNEARQAAFDALQADINRFRERLERHILRRRYFFTRVILNALEPEELIRLIETVAFIDNPGGRAPAAAGALPITAIADTVPVGFVNGAFVLRLKTIANKGTATHLRRHGFAATPPDDIATLMSYASKTLDDFEERKKAGSLTSSDHIYVPTGGLFGEAVLGRSNAAEYLDLERFFHWHEAPIPNAAPDIGAVSTDSRFQSRDVTVTSPEGNLTIVSPQGLPDPSGMGGVLTAIQNGNLFRDMSNAGQLASVVGGLADLSGKVAAAASTMTGDAAKQAMALSNDLARAALTAATPQRSETSKGAEIAKAAEIDRDTAKEQAKEAAEPPASQPGTGGSGTGGGGSVAPRTSTPIVKKKVEAFNNVTGLPQDRPSNVVTSTMFSFILNAPRGASLDNALNLRVIKNGIVINNQTASAGEALEVPLSFNGGLAQLGVEIADIEAPLFLTLKGDVSSLGMDMFVSQSKAFRIPNGLGVYVFDITMKTETIDVKATTAIEAKAALTGKIDASVGLGTSDTDTSGGGNSSVRKPKVSKMPKLPTSVLDAAWDLVGEAIDMTATLSGSASASGNVGVGGSISAEGVFRFHVPTGELDMAFNATMSV